MISLLGVDEENVVGMTVKLVDDGAAKVAFHLVSADPVSAFEKMTSAITEVMEIVVDGVEFFPVTSTVSAMYYSDASFDDERIAPVKDDSYNVAVVVGCTIAGVALILVMVIISAMVGKFEFCTNKIVCIISFLNITFISFSFILFLLFF